MNWVTSEIVTVLTFLLPGFVAAAVFYSLTSHPKPSDAERVIQALIFTIVVQAALKGILLIGGLAGFQTRWSSESETLASVALSIVVALAVVYISNNDFAHGILRVFGVTKETSYPSEWYSAFSEISDQYVVLHLKGERRLYGFPEEWPSDPAKGHFRIAEAQWLTDEETRQLTGIGVILIPVAEVEMVEFVETVLEDDEG